MLQQLVKKGIIMKKLLLTFLTACSVFSLHSSEEEQPNPNQDHPMEMQLLGGALGIWMTDPRTRRDCQITNEGILRFLNEAAEQYTPEQMDYVLNKYLIPRVSWTNTRCISLGHEHALSLAIDKCSTHVVQEMIKLKADARASTENHPVDKVSLIMQTLMHGYMPEQDKTTIVQALINNNASCEIPHQYTGFFPIHQAGHTELTKLLVAHKATVDTPTNASYHEPETSGGTTPLMLAALNGRVDTVRWLLDQGANTQAKNKKGETASDYASQSRRPQKTEICQLLLTHDAEHKEKKDHKEVLSESAQQ